MLIIRKAFVIDEFEFDEEEKTVENFIRQKSVANVDLTHPEINTTDNVTYLWYGLEMYCHYI